MRFVIRKKPSAHHWAEGFLNLYSTLYTLHVPCVVFIFHLGISRSEHKAIAKRVDNDGLVA